MKKVTLTTQEKKYLSQIATDLETGNHLLRLRTGSPLYENFLRWFWLVLKTPEENLTDKAKLALEYYRQCSDHDYYEKSTNKLF